LNAHLQIWTSLQFIWPNGGENTSKLCTLPLRICLLFAETYIDFAKRCLSLFLSLFTTEVLHTNRVSISYSGNEAKSRVLAGNNEQGKCRLTNEYPFFLFLIGHWYYKKYFVFIKMTYFSRYSFVACNSWYA